MKTLFLMLCLVHFISQNKLYAEEFNFVTNAECPNRNRLHPANDTLCGVTNTTVLKCHASRVRCQGRGHWTSVCLFLPSENPRLERDFLENYRSYRCVVTSDFVHANCSSTVNSRLNFIAACNYTFYFCRTDSISCLENFARELEEGGRCPPPGNTCPSPNLFSLTNSFQCNGTGHGFDVPQINYAPETLRRLDIMMPEHCSDHRNTVMYVVLLLVVLVLLIVAVGSLLFCKYRKLKAGVLATLDNDDVMKMSDNMNEDWDRFMKLHQDTDSSIENVDPYIPTYTRLPQKHLSSSDTGFNESSSEDTGAHQENFSSESTALISETSDPVALFKSLNVKNQYEADQNRESDEETAPYELKTYSLKKKLNDSTAKLQSNGQEPATQTNAQWMQTSEGHQQAVEDDEENADFELRTYSLKKKNQDLHLHVLPPASSLEKPFLFDIPMPNDDFQSDFPGYMKKNEPDEYPGFATNLSEDSTHISNQSLDSIDDNLNISAGESSSFPNYLRKTDYSPEI